MGFAAEERHAYQAAQRLRHAPRRGRGPGPVAAQGASPGSTQAWRKRLGAVFAAAGQIDQSLVRIPSVLSATRTVERLTGPILPVQAGSSTASEG